jgi:5-methylcytosine-specific restriction endonuclease McrA
VDLEWKTAVVDHLDEQKANNTPSNLVVSCNDCNRARGSLLPFLRRMRTEAFPVFVEQMQAYRALPA